MQHYVYQGVEYKSKREVRNAIFEHERKAFGSVDTPDEWVQLGVEVIEATPVVSHSEMAARIRYERDTLLRKSDYYVMADYPSTEEGLAEVKVYRQALRDITKQESFPVDVVWPTKPSVLG